MRSKPRIHAFVFAAVTIGWAQPGEAENRIDRIRPDAPELSGYGERAVGLRTLEVTNPDQLDLVRIAEDDSEDADLLRYDRTLPLEIWYPAVAGGGPRCKTRPNRRPLPSDPGLSRLSREPLPHEPPR